MYNIKLKDILFLDIETVPLIPSYELLSAKTKAFWDKKAAGFRVQNQTPDELYQRAGIYAEFGKIVCISVGFIYEKQQQRYLRVKSFAHDDENTLLNQFAQLLQHRFNGPEHYLCAHNGKEFDFPYIARRMLIKGVELPKILQIAGRKPWEVRHLDTLELWKFGDYKHYTSLDLLASIFGIPTPKNDIDGSQVAQVYWQEKDLERIKQYCQRDVITVAQLLLKYRNETIIEPQFIDTIQ